MSPTPTHPAVPRQSPVPATPPKLDTNESPPTEPCLTVSDVSVTIGATTILSSVSLTVNYGEVLCLVGASGAGKTTLLSAIAGLLSPSSGAIRVGNDLVTGPGPDRAVVFQNDAVFPWMTVEHNVAFGLHASHTWSKRDIRQRTKAMIQLVGLTGRDTQLPRTLSGGMRKRVDLARALAVRPKVLLMDEPYAALDVFTKEYLQQEFLRIHVDEPMTVIFVTHDLEEALFLGDRVLVMSGPPGHISASMSVPFPKPRSLDLKPTPDFQQRRAQLKAHIEYRI